MNKFNQVHVVELSHVVGKGMRWGPKCPYSRGGDPKCPCCGGGVHVTCHTRTPCK